MNILTLLIFIFNSLIFLWSVVIIMREKRFKSFIGLHAQIFIINITASIFCILGVIQQFVSQALSDVINQFAGIFFILVIINLVHIVIIIWNLNRGKTESKRSITTIIFFLFIEFIILGSSWTALYFYKNSGDIVLSQYKDYLYAVANSRASHISTLVLDYKTKILADSTVNLGVINCVNHIESDDGACTKEQLNQIILERTKSPIDSAYFIAILNKNGQVISSTDTSLMGQDWSAKPAFINRTGEGYFSNIFFDGEYNQQAVEISHPIISNGNFLGVWIAREKPGDIYDVLQNRTNLGDTGEAILVNEDGTILSPQRFTDEIFIKIDNLNVSGCKDDFNKYVVETPKSLTVTKHDVSIAEYTNKFGRSILGAHVVVEGPTKGLKWCVLVEIGREEALANFNNNLTEAMIFSIIIIIIFTCIFIFTFDFFFQKLFKNPNN